MKTTFNAKTVKIKYSLESKNNFSVFYKFLCEKAIFLSYKPRYAQVTDWPSEFKAEKTSNVNILTYKYSVFYNNFFE
mgnify:CR=1 FL=1